MTFLVPCNALIPKIPFSCFFKLCGPDDLQVPGGQSQLDFGAPSSDPFPGKSRGCSQAGNENLPTLSLVHTALRGISWMPSGA